jgi:hypothetical protein
MEQIDLNVGPATGGRSVRALRTASMYSTPIKSTPVAVFTARTLAHKAMNSTLTLKALKTSKLATLSSAVTPSKSIKPNRHPSIVRVEKAQLTNQDIRMLELHPTLLKEWMKKKLQSTQRISHLKHQIEDKVLDYLAPIEYCPPPVDESDCRTNIILIFNFLILV